MYKCPTCNIEVKTQKSLSNHLTRMHSDMSDLEKTQIVCDVVYGADVVQNLIDSYNNEELCAYDLKKSGYSKIIDLLRLSGLKRTSKEERKTDRYKTGYLKAIQEKYGHGITNISQAKEVQTRKEETYANRYGSYENYLRLNRAKMAIGHEQYKKDKNRVMDVYMKHKDTIREKYGVENIAQIDYVRELNSTSSKEWWTRFSYEERLEKTAKARESVCHRGGYESSIERKVQKILVDNDINFDKHLMMFNYNYDLFIFGDTIIEIQGDMWHGNPKVYCADDIIMGKLRVGDIWEKDEKKKRKAVDAGYKVVYLWENEIKRLTDDEILCLIFERMNEYENC